MNLIELLQSIYLELIVSAIVFILGYIVSSIPGSINKYRLQQFFGDGTLKNKLRVVYGAYTKIPNNETSQPIMPAYRKKYKNAKTYEIAGPSIITTPAALNASSYLLQEFGKYLKTPIRLSTDEEAIAINDNTFICIGGPITNEVSDIAINDSNNKFLRFSIPETLVDSYATIEAIQSQENIRFDKKMEAGHDYGIILKVRNSHAKNNFYFVCAGLARLGTSAAAWYLAHNWKNLYKEFGKGEFGIVVEVSHNQDNLAKIVFKSNT